MKAAAAIKMLRESADRWRALAKEAPNADIRTGIETIAVGVDHAADLLGIMSRGGDWKFKHVRGIEP